MNTELKNPTLIVKPYIKVIELFKKRFDVQNGTALGYRKNQDPNEILEFKNNPKAIGTALMTTGFCVSASQALLIDNVFQTLLKSQGAKAKLVSIDIKEQYYGQCYSGSQNKWHTAILVSDSDYNFIIDLTCGQFGNAFIEKFIWDFKTWEETFRSATCKHNITNFEGKNISQLPMQTLKFDSINIVDIINNLHDITTITDSERKIIAEFFTKYISIINNKLVIGNINKIDFEYLKTINKLIENLNFKIFTDCSLYHVKSFQTKEASKEWVKSLIKNDFISKEYLLFSDSIEKNCTYFKIDSKEINIEREYDFYVILEYVNPSGIDISFLKNLNLCVPYGIKLNVNIENDIFNGGKLLPFSVNGVEKKTNTIYVKINA